MKNRIRNTQEFDAAVLECFLAGLSVSEITEEVNRRGAIAFAVAVELSLAKQLGKSKNPFSANE
jgi:hypothetical protein